MPRTLGTIVAENLRRIREQKKWSQHDLAGFAGLDKNTPGNIERQNNSPTLETLERLALTLGVDPLALFQDIAEQDDAVAEPDES